MFRQIVTSHGNNSPSFVSHPGSEQLQANQHRQLQMLYVPLNPCSQQQTEHKAATITLPINTNSYIIIRIHNLRHNTRPEHKAATVTLPINTDSYIIICIHNLHQNTRPEHKAAIASVSTPTVTHVSITYVTTPALNTKLQQSPYLSTPTVT